MFLLPVTSGSNSGIELRDLDSIGGDNELLLLSSPQTEIIVVPVSMAAILDFP